MVILGDDDRLMALGLVPVVGIIGMFAGRVGETQGYRSPLVFQQVALDTGVEGIFLRMDAGGHFNGLTIRSKRRFDLPVPEKKCLLRLFQGSQGYWLALGILETQTNRS